MKICLAQMKSISGDIEANIAKHLLFIDSALASGAKLIVFPELSITNYEPKLAKELATKPNDKAFEIFQEIADNKNIDIAIGMPLVSAKGITISTIIFRANLPRMVYSKQYLHADEKPFFVSGGKQSSMISENIALAICYEISITTHAQTAAKAGAKIYIASVAKFANGLIDANKRLADIAKEFNMNVLMVNAIGEADGGICDGGSAVWNMAGDRLEHLPNNSEGLIIFDTKHNKLIKKIL